MGIPEMAAKGQAKLTARLPTMKGAWDAAKTRMKSGYAAKGFGPNRTSAYNAGIDRAVYVTPDPNKWATNWAAKMAE